MRTPHPMLDMGFFRNPRFTAACTAVTFTFFVLFGFLFLLTQHLQLGLAEAARHAFVEAIGPGSLVAAGVVLAGAVFVALFLPARAVDDDDTAASAEPTADETVGGLPAR